MQFHEVANIFPLMGDEEFRALVGDIREHGQREPIWTYQGKIIDGRNRFKACEEIAIAPQFREWDGEGSLVAFVVSLNVHRRHMSGGQKAVVALDVERQLAEEAKRRQGFRTDISQKVDIGFGRATEQAANLLGTNRQYVSDAKRIEKDAPELLEDIKSDLLSLPEAKELARIEPGKRERIVEKIKTGESKNLKTAKQAVQKEEKQAIPDDLPELPDRCLLLNQSVADLASSIPPGSVDCIITDPPYPKDYLQVYEELAETATRVLKPGGSMLVMIGQSYLPEILASMSKHIRYHWTLAYLTPGGQSAQLWQRKVNTFWKPVLWFVNGEYAGDWVGDVTKSAVNDNDKRFHEWGQSESGMADLIERFTYPGETILDPFLGGGTTAAVALHLNRRFVGSDVDAATLETVRRRLAVAA